MPGPASDHEQKVFELAKEILAACEAYPVEVGIEAMGRVSSWAFLCVVGDVDKAMNSMVKFYGQTADVVRKQKCLWQEELAGKSSAATSMN